MKILQKINALHVLINAVVTPGGRWSRDLTR
jgi:hypothetical protein